VYPPSYQDFQRDAFSHFLACVDKKLELVFSKLNFDFAGGGITGQKMKLEKIFCERIQRL
jgi:hypothetical protein